MNLLPTAESFVEPSVDWFALTPIVIIFGAAIIGVLVEAFAPKGSRRFINIALSLIAVVTALVVVCLRWAGLQSGSSLVGEYIDDPLTAATQAVLLLVAFVSLLVMADRSKVGDGAFAAQPSDRPGSSEEELSMREDYQRSEIFPLVLFSLGGMMVFPAANSLITLFVALEVMSLPLYVLAATSRRRRQLSQEAGLKYFLLGAFASAFLLMGSALLYGFSGTVTISEIASAVPTMAGMDWALVAGAFMVMVGLLFKIGAAPFHAWTPDVYTGAPTPVTGFMAAAVKAAAFGAMLRFYQTVAGQLEWDLAPIIMGVAALTMVIGTVVGLVQDDIKRLLAYSSIAHAGFILIAVLSLVKGSAGHVLFYILAYGLATVGAFGIVALVRGKDSEGNIVGEATALDRWQGLGKKSPVLAGAMLVFLLSFAGIPLTAGFVGKFVVFSDGIAGEMAWLVGLALLCSVATAFYYFKVAHMMFFKEPTENSVAVRSEGFSAFAIAFCAAGTILLGIFPGPVLALLEKVVVVLP